MNLSGEQLEQLDTLFLSVAQYHPEGASQLLDTFVSFLSRKTDFFVGREEGQWEKLVMSTFKKYEKISTEKHEAQKKRKGKKKAAKNVTKTEKKADTIEEPTEITELANELAQKLQLEIDTKKNRENSVGKNDAPDVNKDENELERELREKSKSVIIKKEFLEYMFSTEDQVEESQQHTIGQSEFSTWRLERFKRLTDFNFGRICKMRNSTHCKNTVKFILYKNFNLNADRNWEIEHGENAISQFEGILNIEVEKCGLFLDPIKPYLGAFPDGLIGNDTIVKIKCPRSSFDMTPIQAILNGEIKFAQVVRGKIKLLRNHDYYYQVQGQLHITRRKKCYFIIWTTVGLEYETIIRNDKFWKEKCEYQLQNFYKNCFLPEITNPQYPSGEIVDLRREYIDLQKLKP